MARLLLVVIIISFTMALTACPVVLPYLSDRPNRQDEPLPQEPEEQTPFAEAPHTAHISGEWEPHIAATCGEAAVEKIACTECGLLLETRTAGEPLGHEYGWYITNKPHSGAAVYIPQHR